MSKRYQGGVLGVGFNPLQAPNAPTIGAATAGNTTVSVAFTAPANVGGSAISTYAVRVSPGNVSATGSSSPISVTGLTNDTTYTFSVAALNSYGPSPYSGTVTATPSQLFVEDVFSTYTYTGTGAGFTGSEQTIQNGINISGQGGMVWIKARVSTSGVNAFYNRHQIYDTQRGFSNLISSNTTDAQVDTSTAVQPLTNGFILASGGSYYGANYNGLNYVSWTFREAPKFFDIVTYTGNGVAGRTISHNLGVAPGCIIVKQTSGTENWRVYHRSTGNGQSLYLNTAAAALGTSVWNSTSPTSTDFTVSGSPAVNGSGSTYVAYLFAHNTASDGIIQCGSYTGNGSSTGPNINLGWEPQWLLVKSSTYAGQEWGVFDSIRGLANYPSGGDAQLWADTADVESSSFYFAPTATGFNPETGIARYNNNGDTYIYIAIRRGPMRTPTSGTSVFAPITWSGTGTNNRVITGAPTASDSILINTRNQATNYWNWNDRLRSAQNTLYPYTTSAENAGAGATYGVSSINMDGFTQGSQDGIGYNASGATAFAYFFKRAPSFFDEVCYTGTGGIQTVSHNLGAVPEFIIGKTRSNSSTGWYCYHSALGNTKAIELQDTAAAYTYQTWANTTPTSSQFYVDGSYGLNISGRTYVAYLFSSCPGVSKVGSYTGTGTTQTINCGFTTGARFVLIKRTDSTGDWYVWDSARGIVAGNDPYLLLNSTAAEVTGTDYIDTDNSGFQISSTAPAAINANGGSFIYLAIS